MVASKLSTLPLQSLPKLQLHLRKDVVAIKLRMTKKEI